MVEFQIEAERSTAKHLKITMPTPSNFTYDLPSDAPPSVVQEDTIEAGFIGRGCKSLSVKCSAFAQPNSPAGAAERRRA
jgi:hypothetical protein